MDKPTRHYSKLQEKAVAKALDGYTVSNSGATPFNKGDVIAKEFDLLLECKTKVKEQKTVSIKKEWLEEIDKEARVEGLTGAVVIDFGEERKDETNQYLVINLKDFKDREEMLLYKATL